MLEKKEQKRNIELEKQEQQIRHGVRANKASDQIVTKKKHEKINEIFDRLDKDEDGEISTHSINVKVLKGGYLEIFKPLLEELAELNEPLDREEFVDAVNRLYDTLNQQDKNLILRFGQRTKEEKENQFCKDECTFKPQINQDV